jgi:hypothetical protein
MLVVLLVLCSHNYNIAFKITNKLKVYNINFKFISNFKCNIKVKRTQSIFQRYSPAISFEVTVGNCELFHMQVTNFKGRLTIQVV